MSAVQISFVGFFLVDFLCCYQEQRVLLGFPVAFVECAGENCSCSVFNGAQVCFPEGLIGRQTIRTHAVASAAASSSDRGKERAPSFSSFPTPKFASPFPALLPPQFSRKIETKQTKQQQQKSLVVWPVRKGKHRAPGRRGALD